MQRLIALLALVLFNSVVHAGEKKATRDIAVRTLQEFNRCLEEKDFKKAITYLKLPKEVAGKEDKIVESLAKIAGSSEISKKGIEVLAEKGKWNALAKLQSEAEAKRMSQGLPPEKCFGLFVGPRRGAAFHWDGSRLLITYFNNIGRLEKE